MNLRIMDKASQLTKFIWAKKRSELFRWMTHKIVARTKDNRFSFFPNNGTVRITNLRKHDSGEYRLVMFKKGRKHKGTRKLKLFIEGNQLLIFLHFLLIFIFFSYINRSYKNLTLYFIHRM